MSCILQGLHAEHIAPLVGVKAWWRWTIEKREREAPSW